MALLVISLAVGFFLVFNLSAGFWWVIFVLSGVSILIAERAR
jgi:hypothetical protein